MSKISINNEIFDELYNEIFLMDKKNFCDDDKINGLIKRYLESKAPVEEKKYFIKLRNQYFKVKNIKDYKSLQKKLYNNNSRREIILFEITRILNSDNVNAKILEQVSDIEKLLVIYNDELSDELYKKIVNLIIRIEISLGIKIGLFNELCSLFENEINRIEKELVVDTLTYSKRK